MGKHKKSNSKKRNQNEFVMVETIEDAKCPFRRCCINGDLEKLASMIENNPTLERVVDKAGWNGFHHAAAEGQVTVLEFLCGIHFDINAKTNAGETAILLASRNGQKEAVELLLTKGADPLISSKSNSNALSEAARKNRPQITSLLQDAIASNIPSSSKRSSSPPPVIVDVTSAEHAQLAEQLKITQGALKQKEADLSSLRAENDFLKTENEIKTSEVRKLTARYAADAAEKEEMLRQIKNDIDIVSLDVTKSNEMLAAEQMLRESLEDENKKLLDIIDKREDTIKKLEERARNALEISIHADNVMKQNSGRVSELESQNQSLMMSEEKLNQKVNELMRSTEQNKAAAEKEIAQKCAQFGIELISKIQAMHQVIKDLTAANLELKEEINLKKADKSNERIASGLKEEVTKLKEENSTLQSRLQEAMQGSEVLSEQVTNLRNQHQAKIKSLEFDLAARKKSETECQNVANLSNELAQKSAKISEMSSEMKQQEVELNCAGKELKLLDEDIRFLLTELARTRQCLDKEVEVGIQLKDQSAAKEKLLCEALSRVKQLKTSLSSGDHPRAAAKVTH